MNIFDGEIKKAISKLPDYSLQMNNIYIEKSY